jgi:hypothetical protein
LLADDHEGNDDHPEEHIGTGDADHYESLIVQRVLSTQMERVEQNQRHTLFQTKCVIKEWLCRMIIDGGSCNNLASSDMVDKLALTTKPHPRPYQIQWLNDSGKAKVTKLEENFFCSFFLSLFFSSNTKTLYTRLWNKRIRKSIEYVEQPQAQIWDKVLGGSGG